MSRVTDLYTFYEDAERAAKDLAPSTPPKIVLSDPANTRNRVRQVGDSIMCSELSEWLILKIKEAGYDIFGNHHR